jgi:hypothetical protein
MTPEAMREKLERYEAALGNIVREVKDQAVLEEHKIRAGLFSDIDLTRFQHVPPDCRYSRRGSWASYRLTTVHLS